MHRKIIIFAIGIGVIAPLGVCAKTGVLLSAEAKASHGSAAAKTLLHELKMAYILADGMADQRTVHLKSQPKSTLRLIYSYTLMSWQGVAAKYFRTPEPSQAIMELSSRVRMWQNRNRDDLAFEAIDKLLRIAPAEDVDVLALLASLQIRKGQNKAARQTLERMRRSQSDHPAIAQIEIQLRLQGEGKDKLRQARQFAKSGRQIIDISYGRPISEKLRLRTEGLQKIQSAISLFHDLYGNTPPTGDTALEYWQLVAVSELGWSDAYVGLNKLVHDNPGNMRYELALAEHLSLKMPVKPEIFRTFSKLADIDEFSKQARQSWRRALLRMDFDQEKKSGQINVSIQYVRDYLKRDPSDSVIQALYAKLDANLRTSYDPNYQAGIKGLALLDVGNLSGAEYLLQQSLAARPNDAEIVGGMGLLQLRLGHHSEAQGYFLMAQKLAPAQHNKWESLFRTAKYWGLLRVSKDAANAGEFLLAEQKLTEASKLLPKEPEGVIALARLYEDQAQPHEAEQAYQQALALAPTNIDALRGLATLYMRNGHEKEAQVLMALLTPEQRHQLELSIQVVKAKKLWQQADQLLAKQQPDEAVVLLEQAALLDDGNAFLHYDLARLYAGQGRVEQGSALFRQLLGRYPNSTEALYAAALYQSGHDQEAQALATLERIHVDERSSGMSRLQRRLWVNVQNQRILWLAKNGRTEAATTLLGEVEQAVGHDQGLVLDVADTYIEIGEIQHARILLKRYSDNSISTDWQLRQAKLLVSSSSQNAIDDVELDALLEHIAGAAPLSQVQGDQLSELKRVLIVRRVDALRQQGRLAESLQLIQSVLPAQMDTSLQLKQAAILRNMQRYTEADAIYQHILTTDPANNDVTLALVNTYIEAGQIKQAQQQIEQAWHNPQPNNPEFLVVLLSHLIDIKDFDQASKLADLILSIDPQQVQALRYASRLAQEKGHLEQAIEYLQRALAIEETGRQAAHVNSDALHQPSGELKLQSLLPKQDQAGNESSRDYHNLAGMLDENTTRLSSAVDWYTRAGTSGESQLNYKEMTVEWKQAAGIYGRPYWRADIVQMDAGAIDLASTQASNFGSRLLCGLQPACSSGSVAQNASGIAFSAGLAGDRMRLDIGASPIGFPVQNISGGVFQKGSLGLFSYSVDASRRPVTSSLLSFAGTTDTRTGKVWGGVQATGVRLGLSLDNGGALGFWSSLGWHSLSGKNVENNNRKELMAGGYWRAINEENQLLTIGMTGIHWNFSKNVGMYTFGQGGYFSPKSFTSIALPVTYGERGERFSYRLRAAVSVSRTETDAVVYFPTDATMQANAMALSAANGVVPIYSASTGNGFGKLLSAEWEYQMNRKLFIGGVAQIDRSIDYAPNRLFFYLRYAVDQTAAKPVSFPPEPLIPTSQF